MDFASNGENIEITWADKQASVTLKANLKTYDYEVVL
jgi:hypothetical protein